MSATAAITPSAVHIEDRIHRIFDHLYANASVRTPKGIAYETGKILRTAMYAESQVSGPAFRFSRTDMKRIDSGDRALIRLVSENARRQFTSMNRAWKLYPPKEEIALNDFDLTFVCVALGDILVGDRRRDVFGDALEIFRYEWAKRNGGQFFTDQRVTHLAISLLRFNPVGGDDIVDLCAGSGGFLLAGLNLLEQEASRAGFSQSEMVKLACRKLHGMEADREVAQVCNATLMARIGDDKAPIVLQGNSLLAEPFADSRPQGIRYGAHLCAATNPPFGTKITIKDPLVLRHYELALSSQSSDLLFASRFSPRAPDVLFIEQNIKILKPGMGRLAIVVPYQITSGPQALFVREWILKNARVLAVVDLPGETFQPHTGTKTCLLVLQRRERPLEKVNLDGDGPIFMAIPRWIGHDRRGNPIYRRRPDGALSDDVLSDMETVGEAYTTFLDGKNPGKVHPDSFRVTAEDITKDSDLRINAQFHRPHSEEFAALAARKAGVKKSGWGTTALGDLVKRVFYPGRFKRNYVEPSPTATPFLGGTSISQLLITTDKWVERETAASQELLVEPGWILITRSGSTGIASSVPVAWSGYAISEHVIRIIPDPEKLPGEFLLAFLRSRYAQELLSKGVYGSVIDEINPEFICGLKIPIPPHNILVRVTEDVRTGETQRNEAIVKLMSGVERLEEAMNAS